MAAERSALHVLPHPGGGGETYVDHLGVMAGFRFDRICLAPGPRPAEALPALLPRTVRANVAARRHDLIHAHGEITAALCLPSLALGPSVVTLHGTNLVRRLDGIRRRAAAANLRLILRAAGCTICVAPSEHRELLELLGPKAARRAVTIANGVELPPLPSERERAAARAELGAVEGVTLALWVGSLDPPKDPVSPAHAALEVTRSGVPFRLLVAGQGSLVGAVEAASRGHPDAVSILGRRDDVRRLLAAADLFVLSSHREGLPFSLLEAMAMGIPAVVSATDGLPEALGDAGIQVAAGDVAAVAAAFTRLAGDPGERERLGGAARDRVSRDFRAERMVEETRMVYEQVLRERS